MRHNYVTPGLIISRTPLGEESALLVILTPQLGLIRARAQGVRKAGAKLAPALTTLTESDLVLVKGREGWRVSGAVLGNSWAQVLSDHTVRSRAARLSGLLVRLVAGEARETELYPVVQDFLIGLRDVPPTLHEAVELVSTLRVLRALGLDAGEMPEVLSPLGEEVLRTIDADRLTYLARINHGINASGL